MAVARIRTAAATRCPIAAFIPGAPEIAMHSGASSYQELTFDIHGFPYPANTPLIPFMEVSMPAGWTSESFGNVYTWHATSPEFYVYPGQTLPGIQIVLSQPQACYLFSPSVILLDGTPQYPVCFACPGVTPASSSTWGRVKQTYR